MMRPFRMPVGAFAGPAAHFEQLAPLGGIYQAGTLSGNPVAMAAGLKTLEVLSRDDVHTRLEALGQRLEHGAYIFLLAEVFEQARAGIDPIVKAVPAFTEEHVTAHFSR